LSSIDDNFERNADGNRSFHAKAAFDLDPIRVFVSYSHRDVRHKEELESFIVGLDRKGFAFWSDERIETGEPWDELIRSEIARSHIALVLVSQAFLNSAYCRNVEVAAFLEKRKHDGMVVFPVVLSPCSWSEEPWLASTQFEPRGGRTVEEHYTRPGSRKRLYLTVRDGLVAAADRIVAARSTSPRGPARH
jgi:hypothetical protein